MLEHYFSEPAHLKRSREGPLGDHLDSFAELLFQQGYTRNAARVQFAQLSRLAAWLKSHGLEAADLDEHVTQRYLATRRPEKTYKHIEAAALRHFFDHLRAKGVVSSIEPKLDDSPLGKLKTRYEEYLRKQRGISQTTVTRYWPIIRSFLRERFGDAPLRFDELSAQYIAAFLTRHAHSRTPKIAKLMVTALRSLFRFLFQHEETKIDLSAVVPTVPSWRLAEVPKYLKPEEIDRVLETCDRSTPKGRRNYAILLLVVRLGLRANEVVKIELDDLNWRAGEITVRGKGKFRDRLPIPQDVGEALVDYLRNDRPKCSTRRLFVRTRAPIRGFNNPSTLSTIVSRALIAAGLDPATKGTNLLRNSLATGMLRKGASMAEIGEVLRHRSTNSTEIYVKVDIEGLRSLARSWPKKGGRRDERITESC